MAEIPKIDGMSSELEGKEGKSEDEGKQEEEGVCVDWRKELRAPFASGR